MSVMSHFVCDRCGNYWRGLKATTCPACHAQSVWEFGRERPAREHAAHVARAHKSGLFREAKS